MYLFRWKEKYNEEKSRSKELMQRLEREKQLEIESMGLRYQVSVLSYSRQLTLNDKLSVASLTISNSSSV
jgi:hypothetical protein